MFICMYKVLSCFQQVCQFITWVPEWIYCKIYIYRHTCLSQIWLNETQSIAQGMTNKTRALESLQKKGDCMFMRTHELGVLAFESDFASSAEPFAFGTTGSYSHVLGKRFRQVLGTFSSRLDWLSSFSMTIILNCRHSLNCGIAQCFCKIGGNLRWVEQNGPAEVDPAKSGQTTRPHDFRRENFPYLLSDFSIFVIRFFHICYQIQPGR